MRRRICLLAGVAALGFAWLAPLTQLVGGPFAGHMIMHMSVVAVAAPLLALGLTGSALDPVRRAPALFPPIPASILELVVVWAWHTPALHHAARHSTTGFFVEQGAFLLSGLAVWLASVGGSRRAGNRTGAGVLALLLTSMHMTLLGALLALSPRALFHHQHVAARLSPLEDQHLGGAIMLVAGGIIYMAGGLSLSAGFLRSPARLRRHGEAAP